MIFCCTECIDGQEYCRQLEADDWPHAERTCAERGWLLDGELVAEIDADKITPEQVMELCDRRNAGQLDS